MTMYKIVCAALLLPAGLLLGTAVSADDVLGKMGDAELHSSELTAVLETQSADARRQLGNDAAALERLVRSELMRKAVLNEARQKGWDKRPELQPLIERARDQVVVSSFVANIAKPPQGYPSEDEIKQFFEANKSQLLAPAQFHLAQIFLPAAEGISPAKADEVRKKIPLIRQVRTRAAIWDGSAKSKWFRKCAVRSRASTKGMSVSPSSPQKAGTL